MIAQKTFAWGKLLGGTHFNWRESPMFGVLLLMPCVWKGSRIA